MNLERPLAKKSRNFKQINCKLKALKCYRSSESDGDEVYLKIEDRKIWPQVPFARIKAMGELEINLDIMTGKKEGSIRIELWEKDLLKDDLLGYFLFITNGQSGEYVSDLKLNNKMDNHRYALCWEV
ncbi:hypothetical protein WSM22_44340 [Cytophagales bacterium WSM2-2]|nr:hypothetical protein WSM22_44340 [Cytophagales bacterium WSM2-2]